jgi:hypothetical protein
LVKSQRSSSYDFSYKLINAYSNQIVASQTQNITAQDAIEYQEFVKTFKGNINTLYPYNPQVPVKTQFNVPGWRNLFSARNSLKTMEELKEEGNKKALNLFINSAGSMK